jgi:hypothetical protein
MRIRLPAPALVVFAAALAAVLAAGCSGRATSGSRQVDPAVRAAAAVTGLERTEFPVTQEQAARLLPLFRALRGTPAEDRPAVAALVRQIDAVLTDAQREALRRLREQRRPGDPGGPNAPPGTGPGPRAFGPGGPPAGGPSGAGQPSAERTAAFRGRMLDRAIAVLEDRAQ